MLTDKEKKEFADRLEKLKSDQETLRKSLDQKKSDPEDAERFKPLGIVYEFIGMILAFSFAGFFIGKATKTMPWTMIVIIITGFIYSFIRLYKSLPR